MDNLLSPRLRGTADALERPVDPLLARDCTDQLKELHELNAQLEIQATTDALTGQENRALFHNSLTEMIVIAERSVGIRGRSC